LAYVDPAKLEKPPAGVHRFIHTTALTDWRRREISPMESRIELAIARQTVEVQKMVADQIKFYRVVALCAQAAFVLGLLILLKFH
jgi:hypothetical protein